MNARRSLFTNTFPVFDDLSEPAGTLFGAALEQLLDYAFLVAGAGRVHPIAALLHLIALVQQQCRIATVIDDQFGAFAARMSESSQCEIPVLLQRFTFEGKHADAGFGDRRRRMVLRA